MRMTRLWSGARVQSPDIAEVFRTNSPDIAEEGGRLVSRTNSPDDIPEEGVEVKRGKQHSLGGMSGEEDLVANPRSGVLVGDGAAEQVLGELSSVSLKDNRRPSA